jgi:4-hydroxymandelate synthase
MAARDTAYVELYAKDKQQTAHSFVSLGFTCVADSVAPDRSSLLLRQGAAHLVITSGPATWKFLDTHGEGVADIALLCADVTATAQRAVRAGAGLTGSIRGNPILSGAGGLTHALLPATRTANLLPAGHRWVELPQDLGPSAEGNWRLDRVSIAVDGPDPEAYLPLYVDALGFVRQRPGNASGAAQEPSAVLLDSADGGTTLTLFRHQPRPLTGESTSHAGDDDRPGVRQLSFLVDDIAAARPPRLSGALSIELVQRGGSGGDAAQVLAPRKAGNHHRLTAG